MKFFYTLAVCWLLFGQSLQAQNVGFEAATATPPSNWTPVTGTWLTNTNASFVRTGQQSMSLDAAAASGTTIANTTGYVPNTSTGNFLITMAWGITSSPSNGGITLGHRIGSSSTFNPSSVASGTAANLNGTSWTRITSSSAVTVAAGTAGSAIRAYRTSTGTNTIIYIDDVITYVSSSNVPDLTGPLTPLTVNRAGNILTWLHNNDQGAPASGIAGTVIIRANGANVSAPALNDQAMYSTTGAASGVSTFTDANAVQWTVVAAINNASTLNFDDASAGTGPFTYVVYSRDFAYNYSVGAVATTLTACSGLPVAGSTVVSPSASDCALAARQLTLTGNVPGLGITYEWQTSPTVGGTYTSISTPSAIPSLTINPTNTAFYRAAVTCGANVSFSTPVEVLVTPLRSGSFTINNNAPASATNFTSFTSAVDFIRCGINGPVTLTVVPNSGPYTEQVSIPNIVGTSATNRIRIIGNGARIGFAGTVSSRHVIQINGTDWLEIDSLNVVCEAAGQGFGIHVTNDANNVTIRRCIIDNSISTSTGEDNSGGIIVSGSSADVNLGTAARFLRISKNKFTGGYQGIGVAGLTPESVTGLQIDSNEIADFYISGIVIAGADSGFVHHNNIHRLNKTTPISIFEGIELSGASSRMRIFSNRIHDTHTAVSSNTSAAYGIFDNNAIATTGRENIYTNNLIYNFNGAGLQYGIYSLNSDHVWYQHNTIVLNSNNSGGTVVTRGIYQLTDAQGVRIQNNIVVATRTGTSTGNRHALYFGTNTSSIISNRNVLLSTTTPTGSGIGFYNVNFPTLSDWQTANNAVYDANSVSTDPLFENVADSNFTPTDPSVIGIGEILGVPTDILNRVRSAVPTPGAFEPPVPSCTQPAIAGTLNSSATEICPNSTFSLTLSGASAGLNTSYEFQTSPNNSTWTTLRTRTVPSLDTFQAQTAFYRVLVRCASGTAVPTNAVQITSPALAAGTYTVNAALPASATNFTSLTQAAQRLRCGVTAPVVINVAPGSSFTEQFILNEMPGTSVVNTVRFNGNGSTISFVSTNGAERALVKLNGADHVTIDSFIISSSASTTAEFSYGVQLLNNADSNTISRCQITLTSNPVTATSTSFSGIVVNSSGVGTPITTGSSLCDGNTFMRNTIIGGYAGISLYGNGATSTIANNRVMNNVIQDFHIYGIALNGGINTLIEGNDISRPTRTSVGSFHGVFLSGVSRGTRIVRNRIHHSFQAVSTPSNTHSSYGVNFSTAPALAGQENVVANNFIYAFNGDGIQNGLLNTASDHALYYHNSIVLDDQTVSNASTGNTRGFYQTTTAIGIQLINNTFSITRSGTVAKEVLFFNTSSSSIRSRNNNLYINTPSAVTSSIGSASATLYPTLASWKAINFDTASLSVLPGHVSDADLHLLSNSPIRDSGLLIAGIVNDIDGDLRSGSFTDIGADELPGVVLPVQMISFTGYAAATSNELSWMTAQETTNKGFAVQRSRNGQAWEQLAFVEARTDSRYAYSDAQPWAGTSYYRLIQTDLNGRTQASKVLMIARKAALADVRIWPNPAQNLVQVQWVQPTEKAVQISLINASGMVVFTSGVLPAGTGQTSLSLQSLASGNYRLLIRTTQGQVVQEQAIVKQ